MVAAHRDAEQDHDDATATPRCRDSGDGARSHTRRTCLRPKRPVRLDEQHEEQHRERDRQAKLGRREADVLADEVEEDAEHQAADDGADRALEPAEHRGRERVAGGSAASSSAAANCVGSVIRPATAPSIAASPQPIASIRFTRTPTSDAAAGRSAAARIARPTFVNWKSAHSATIEMIDTAKTPMSCAETATPPLRKTCVAERRRHELDVRAPDPRDEAVDQDEQTERHDHDRDHGPVLDGADEHAVREDAEHETEHQREEEREPVRHAPVDELVAHVRRRHRHLALREVDHLGRAVDEDERQREAAEDRALRKSRDGLLREDVADEAADEEEDGRAGEPHEHRAPRRRWSLLSVRARPSISSRGSSGGRTRAPATPRSVPRAQRGRPRGRTRSARAAARCARSARRRARSAPRFRSARG